MKRKRYTAEFKAKVALEAIQGEHTMAELASRHALHPNLIGLWKKQAVEKLARVFDDKAGERDAGREAEMAKLHAKIGELVVERDFCPGPPVDEPRSEEEQDRARSPAALGQPTVPAAQHRTLELLPSPGQRERGQSRAHSPDRCLVPGDTLVHPGTARGRWPATCAGRAGGSAAIAFAASCAPWAWWRFIRNREPACRIPSTGCTRICSAGLRLSERTRSGART